MKLSVVIPVYHVEQTLDRCVASVLRQNIDDMEVILVDDGSEDRCPQMCDEWAARDGRIRVIHQQNGGLSQARNTGIGAATGGYITFVDSDDWVEDDTYRPLMHLLAEHPEYDMLEYPYTKGDTRFDFPFEQFADANDYWLRGQLYRHTFAWNKIFRRDLFEQVRFPAGRVFEDMYALPLLTQKARLMATCGIGCYHYTWNEDGITMTASGQQIQQLLEGQMRAFQMLTNRQDNEYRQAFYLQMLNTQLEVFSKGGAVILEPYKGQLALRSKYTWPCKLKITFYHLFGIKALCRIYYILNLLILHR